MPTVEALRTPGLGDTSYLLAHDGVGVLVDPQRDIDRFVAAASDAGVELRWVLETHLHNDYVSGAWEAARRTGAELVLPAAAGAAYPHTLAFHNEELAYGGLRLRPIHTPGHTPEHTSYLLLADGEPFALFSGGSLLVGAAGRTDLLGPHRAVQLARAQYASVRRLASLPGHVGLYPTHGEGSFCTASGAGRTTSTIATECATNPVLAYPDRTAFVVGELDGLQPYPSYYARMGPINVSGAGPMPRRAPPVLHAGELARLGADMTVVDIRPRDRSAAGLPPGALASELSDQLGVWLGWLLPFDAPLALLAEPGQDTDEAVVQLARIGFEHVVGVARDVDSWPEPLATFELAGTDRAVRLLREGAQLLDVRSPGEWPDGEVEGAVRCYLPDLAGGVPAELDRDRPVVVACATGYRSTMAASLLLGEGCTPVVLDGEGMPELARALDRAGAA